MLNIANYCCCLVATAKSLQLCLTLCNPIDGSPPGSPIPGILHARTLEWVAISFSSAWKWKLKVKSLNRVWLFATPCTAAYQAPPSMRSSRQDYWSRVPLSSPVGCPILLWSHGLWPNMLLSPWDFPGKNTVAGCHFLLQGIFLTQGSNPYLLHWQAGPLPLSHQPCLTQWNCKPCCIGPPKMDGSLRRVLTKRGH